MLRSLHLKDVGPASRFDLELGERLNVLTGDNGLGKSFILDVAWWALTGTWITGPILPQEGKEASAELAGEIGPLDDSVLKIGSQFIPLRQQWKNRFRDPDSVVLSNQVGVFWSEEPGQAPVLYVRADGGFSVWDPARNYDFKPRSGNYSVATPNAYHFDAKALWDGLIWNGKTVCNGLIQDWVTWQLEAEAGGSEHHPFDLLRQALAELSHPLEIMRPGKPVRLFLDDVRKFPTIEMPYGSEPVIHASAGMQRVLGLAYLIAWSWTEHLSASRLVGWNASSRFVVLIDEPETHLHPRWQRHIIPAVVGVLSGLAPSMRPQLLVTTHSPLVLASIEPHFNAATDRQFLFELKDRQVMLRQLPWIKRGDAIGWLTSEVFDLDQARSIEAERAIEAAEAFMRGELTDLPEGLRTEDEIHRELLRLLPDQDRFWPRWIVKREQRRA